MSVRDMQRPTDAQSNEQQGEGFAFFRWHAFAFNEPFCKGINDGSYTCWPWWHGMQKQNKTALDRSQTKCVVCDGKPPSDVPCTGCGERS